MSRKLFTALTVIGLSTSLSIAAAQDAGTVAGVTGADGSVVVVRGGETFSLASGDTLFDGDRIVTRDGASIEVNTPGCSRSIPANSTIVIASGFCDATIASVDQTVLAEAGLPTAGGGVGAALPVIGGLAAAGGVAAAAGGGGGGDSAPSSP